MSSLKSIRRSLRKQLTTVRLSRLEHLGRHRAANPPFHVRSPSASALFSAHAARAFRTRDGDGPDGCAGRGGDEGTGECPRKGSCQRQCSTPLKKMRSSHFEHSLRIQILLRLQIQMDFQRTCWMRDALNHRAVHCFKLCKPFLCDLISMGIIYR